MLSTVCIVNQNGDKTMLKELRQAAQELNEHMGLEPPIETDNVDKGYLIQKIAEAQQMVNPADEFSDQTLKVLQMIKEQEQ